MNFKFIVGGALILAAVAFLIFSASQANAQRFVSVDELLSQQSQLAGKPVRITGAVIGDTIQYDAKTLRLTFTVADVPSDNAEIERMGGLGAVLHEAVIDPNRRRLSVEYYGPKPDLLRHEAQAIMTGSLNAQGVFQVDELLLKCPTKYEDAVPVYEGK